jgi:hypothetical protein
MNGPIYSAVDPIPAATPPSPKKSKVVTIRLEIPDIACESIMSTALEGGIGYWSQADNIVYAAGDLRTSAADAIVDTDETLYWSYDLTSIDPEEPDEDVDPSTLSAEELFESGTKLTVNYDVIRLGIQRLFSRHTEVASLGLAREYFMIDHGEWMQNHLRNTAAPMSAQIWGGQSDADSCDTIVQLGLFGEVVYG